LTLLHLSGSLQEAELAPPGGAPPVRVSAVLPFTLRAWLGDSITGGLQYTIGGSSLLPMRMLALRDEHGPRLTLVGKRSAAPVQVEPSGLSMVQSPAARSGPSPAHTYWYPLPVAVRSSGAVTTLWQRQAVMLSHPSGPGRIAVVVLASEVAKPHGRSAHLFEGSRYNLDLLVLQNHH
jgi:hypothetical protein